MTSLLQNWDLVRPFMGLSEPELKDLASTGVYIAGFTDPDCFNRKDLYDLYVNLQDKRFFIPDHAKGAERTHSHFMFMAHCREFYTHQVPQDHIGRVRSRLLAFFMLCC